MTLHYFIEEYDPNTCRKTFMKSDYPTVKEAVDFLSTVTDHYSYGTFHANDFNRKSYEIYEGFRVAENNKPVINSENITPPLEILDHYGYHVDSTHPEIQDTTQDLISSLEELFGQADLSLG